ncbi:hypothetical protein ACFL6E_02855, partial [Candidatus Neomarinimicrobiota bacterium]
MFKKLLMYSVFCIATVGVTVSNAQWDVLDGSITPVEAGWLESNATNGDEISEITQVVNDPDIAGNKLIRVDSYSQGASFKEMWKKEIGGDPAVGQTLVFRAVALDTSLFERGIDVYLYDGAYRDRIFTRSTGIVEFDKADSVRTLDATKWHIYRLTGKDSVFTLYIDESTTPLVTAITPASDDSKYTRFGDGGGNTFGAVYDWFIWDTTGAYAPDEGTALPTELSIVTGVAPSTKLSGWDVFTGDILPQDAGWIESNATNGDEISEILTVINDPDDAINKLIRVDSYSQGASFKEMWKKEIGGDPNVGQTLVFRAVALDTSLFERGIDMYLYDGAYRDRIFTRSTGIVEFDKADSVRTLDATKWHIYRLTGKDSVFTLYIDESTTPLVTAITPASDDSKYFRFGDGGGNTFGAAYDWIVWDTTGAYAPGEGAEIPPGLSESFDTTPPVLAGWDVFTGDVLPQDAGWVESNATNGDEISEITTVIDDPDDDTNQLIRVDSYSQGASFK